MTVSMLKWTPSLFPFLEQNVVTQQFVLTSPHLLHQVSQTINRIITFLTAHFREIACGECPAPSTHTACGCLHVSDDTAAADSKWKARYELLDGTVQTHAHFSAMSTVMLGSSVYYQLGSVEMVRIQASFGKSRWISGINSGSGNDHYEINY